MNTLKEAIEVLTAAEAGKAVEYRTRGDESDPWRVVLEPKELKQYMLYQFEYRIAQRPAYRPLTPQELLQLMLQNVDLRRKDAVGVFQRLDKIAFVGTSYSLLLLNEKVSHKDLADNWEYSLDDSTWTPCHAKLEPAQPPKTTDFRCLSNAALAALVGCQLRDNRTGKTGTGFAFDYETERLTSHFDDPSDPIRKLKPSILRDYYSYVSRADNQWHPAHNEQLLRK